MPRATSTKTKPSQTALPDSAPVVNLKELPTQLLTPEEFDAITHANYYHPESQLILRLFLQANYFWHIARQMQGKPTNFSKPVDWQQAEENAAKLISETLSRLLPGVTVTPWEPAMAKARTRK